MLAPAADASKSLSAPARRRRAPVKLVKLCTTSRRRGRCRSSHDMPMVASRERKRASSKIAHAHFRLPASLCDSATFAQPSLTRLRAMRSVSVVLLALAATVVAHFQLESPPPRGPFVEDDEPTFCDGYTSVASPRVQFPLSTTNIVLNSGTPPV